MKHWKLLNSYQKRYILRWLIITWAFFFIFTGYTALSLYREKQSAQDEWDGHLTECNALTDEEQAGSAEALHVSLGTYVESIDAVDIKNSNFKVSFQVFFSWYDADNRLQDMSDNFRIYNGTVNSIKTLQDYTEDQFHYQLFQITATVHHVYETKRFPLSSYPMRFYLMPNTDISAMVFEPLTEASDINPSLSIAGFTLTRHDTGMYYHHDTAAGKYVNAYKDSVMEAKPLVYSEFMTCLELNRASFGLYLKCVIALIGTSIWALIAMYMGLNQNINSVGMLAPVFIGTVTNILVGAGLVPDALETGLLEYINIFGIYTVIIISICIVNMNQIRKKYNDEAFAFTYGKCMLYTIIITTAMTHILLPLSAYQF